MSCDAGAFGYYWDIKAVPSTYYSPPAPEVAYVRYDCRFNVPGQTPSSGELFWVAKDSDPPELVPIDNYQGVYPVSMHNTHYKIYRPHAIERVSEETYGELRMGYLAPLTGRWETSETYAAIWVNVHPRNSMEFCALVPSLAPMVMVESSEAAVAAGGTLLGVLRTRPYPTADINLRYDLSGTNGYSGDLGELSVQPHQQYNDLPPSHSLMLTGTWDFTYNAPKDIKSPIDVVATFSVFDPWADERRELKFTYHVTPAK